MTARQFPQLTPTRRTYKPGKIPETIFTSQNGSSVFVQFGGALVNAELTLTFANIDDSDAADILAHYNSMTGDDNVLFGDTRGLGGMSTRLQNQMETGRELLKFRYDGPPEIESVYPGVSNVTCSFIGYLYGA